MCAWKSLCLVTSIAMAGCSGSVVENDHAQKEAGSAGAGPSDAAVDVLPSDSPLPTDGPLPSDAPSPTDSPLPTDAPVPPDSSAPDAHCLEPEADFDGDGYTILQGDCDDCNPHINPGAYDYLGDGLDNDCNGTIDDGPHLCDQGLAMKSSESVDGARAIGLCRSTSLGAEGKDKTWGVIRTRYVKADGTEGMNPLSHGLLANFGPETPPEGVTMLALSTGTARAPNHPDYSSNDGANMGTTSNPPPGYPKPIASCPGVILGSCNDPAAFEIDLRVPTNAHSFSFKFNFYSSEFPVYVCSQYNDIFVTMMAPIPSGIPDGNICFGPNLDPISPNTTLLQVCKAQTAGGNQYDCPLGPAGLEGTGFEGKGATGWLQTTAPVDPGSIINLRFTIWDSGDAILDSLVLIDDFQWSIELVPKVVTTPVL